VQNVNKELQEFFTEEDVGFTDDILNFLEENKDWEGMGVGPR
jgi:spore coat polysaccharide biosynthesis protein SpsF (cytidylyltransferase family)